MYSTQLKMPGPLGGVSTPAPAGRARDAVAVEVGGDALRSLASDIFAEDASHDLRTFIDDFAVAACIELVDDTIAIGIAAADLAGLDAASDAAMGRHGEVLQEQRVHRALEADMKLADLAF